MYKQVRSLLFRLPPEWCHYIVLRAMMFVGSTPLKKVVGETFSSSFHGSPVHVFGLTFPNPVGLAAGYDKDGLGWRGLATLGFGHIEVGTVTTLPQAGKPKPRVFRLEGEEAIINRMGFPNRGSAFLVERLKGPRPKELVLGVSIGKHVTTLLEDAAKDYVELFRTFAPLVDYIAVNVSSPNTTGLRGLQARKPFLELLDSLSKERTTLTKYVPLLVKISPDLEDDSLDDVLEVLFATKMDGAIVANTSMGRDGLTGKYAKEEGGLSGKPIRGLSTEMVRKVVKRTEGKLPIVASGGIMYPEDAKEKLDAGASLVQLFTGFVYHGPRLVESILEMLFEERAEGLILETVKETLPQVVWECLV